MSEHDDGDPQARGVKPSPRACTDRGRREDHAASNDDDQQDDSELDPRSGTRRRPPVNAEVHPLRSALAQARLDDDVEKLAADAADVVRRLFLLAFRRLPLAERVTPSISENWISISEGAEHAGVGTSTLREWIARGELREGRHQGTVRVRKSDIDAVLLAGGHGVERTDGDGARLHPRAAEILLKSEDG
jgi:excisionase family DNA binding protein